MFTPFSLWKLPVGTTRLEFVTSGRSVAISSLAVGQESTRASARASAVASDAIADTRLTLKVRLFTDDLDRNGNRTARQRRRTVQFTRRRARAKKSTLVQE
jgi:hypothetical protein